MDLSITDFDKGIEGRIDVRLPTNGERLKLMSDHGVDFFDMQKMSDQDEKSQNQIGSDILIKVMDHVGGFVKLVDLKTNGKHLESFDEIACDMRLVSVQMKIAAVVLFGADELAAKKNQKSKKPLRSSTTNAKNLATGTNS